MNSIPVELVFSRITVIGKNPNFRNLLYLQRMARDGAVLFRQAVRNFHQNIRFVIGSEGVNLVKSNLVFRKVVHTRVSEESRQSVGFLSEIFIPIPFAFLEEGMRNSTFVKGINYFGVNCHFDGV